MPMHDVHLDDIREKLGVSEDAELHFDSNSKNTFVTSIGHFYRIYDRSTHRYASLYIAEFPGCCGIGVLHHTDGDIELALALGECVLADNRIALAYYTVRADNRGIIAGLEAREWKKVHDFKNVKYSDEGTRIVTYRKEIPDAVNGQ